MGCSATRLGTLMSGLADSAGHFPEVHAVGLMRSGATQDSKLQQAYLSAGYASIGPDCLFFLTTPQVLQSKEADKLLI